MTKQAEAGNVIQVVKDGDWFGALFIVEESKDWGVVAYMSTPAGTAYIRLAHSSYEIIGDAVIVRDGEADE